MQLFYQLATLKKGSDSIFEYFRKAKTLIDTLATSGKIFSQSEFVMFFLSGLGSEFDSFVSSATTLADLLSSEQLFALLLTYEAHLQQ